jgi:hypothetical protein
MEVTIYRRHSFGCQHEGGSLLEKVRVPALVSVQHRCWRVPSRGGNYDFGPLFGLAGFVAGLS